MIYKIIIRPKAQKFIDKQDKVQRLRLYKAIYNLPNGDVKKLSGTIDDYRLRVGDYRIIYTIKNDELIILITKVANRGQVYKF